MYPVNELSELRLVHSENDSKNSVKNFNRKLNPCEPCFDSIKGLSYMYIIMVNST